MSLNPVRWVTSSYDLAKKIETLLGLQEKTSLALDRMRDEIAEVRRDIERLKVREEIVVAKAEAAASVAASAVGSYSSADLARRIGHLEARLNASKPPSLPPPS